MTTTYLYPSSVLVSYIGLLPKQSNPKLLFKVLKALCDQDAAFKNDLELNFVGDISAEIKVAIEANTLAGNTNFVGYISHQKAIAYQNKSQVLLLLIPNVKNNKGILTGKLFEYLNAKRPIIAIGPEKGDLAAILQETNSGVIVDFDAEEKLKLEIMTMYQKYKKDKLRVDCSNIEKYHRKELTKKLASILKSLNS